MLYMNSYRTRYWILENRMPNQFVKKKTTPKSI